MTLLFHSFERAHIRNDRNSGRNTRIVPFQCFHLDLGRAGSWYFNREGADGRGILGATMLLNGHLQPFELLASELRPSHYPGFYSGGQGLKKCVAGDT